MPKRCREHVSVVFIPGCASFRFEDGAVVDVEREVLSRSSLLMQTLADTDETTTPIHLDTPPGFVRSWLQWARQEQHPESCDAEQLVQYLMAADFLIDDQMVGAVRCWLAHCLLGSNPPTKESIQVLEDLPKNLQALVLAAAPKSLLSLLPVIPPHLHMEALHAVHPSLSSDGSLRMIHRDAAADNEELLWALLPSVPMLESFYLRITSRRVDLSRLAAQLSKLSALKRLFLECNSDEFSAVPDNAAELCSAIGKLTALQSLSLAGLCLGGKGAQALAAELLHLTGLTHLNLGGTEFHNGDFVTLAPSLTVLTSLHELLLGCTDIMKEGMEAFAPHLCALSQLKILDLRSCNISFAADAVLVVHLHKLRNLQHLLLGGGVDQLRAFLGFNMMPYVKMQTLGACLPSFTDLRVLDLSSHVIRASGLRALLQPLSDPHPLLQLHLENTFIGDDGATELAEHLPKLVNLEELDISGNEVTHVGANTLAPRLECLTQLSNLNLGGNRLGAQGVAVLARHITRLSHLEDLDLGLEPNAYLSGHGCVTGLQQCLPSLTSLRCLSLGGGLMPTLPEVEAFMPLLSGLRDLENLTLRNNGLESHATMWLAYHIHKLNELTALDLSSNPLGRDGMKALAPALCWLQNMEALDLSECHLVGAEAVSHLVSCFPYMSDLQFLELDRNCFVDEEAILLSQHLRHLPCLERLSLEENSIGLAGVTALASEAVHLRNIELLDLGGNAMGDVEANAPHLCHSFINYKEREDII